MKEYQKPMIEVVVYNTEEIMDESSITGNRPGYDDGDI